MFDNPQNENPLDRRVSVEGVSSLKGTDANKYGSKADFLQVLSSPLPGTTPADRVTILENGYEPLPILAGTKRPSNSNWQAAPLTHETVSGWNAAGTGLRTGLLSVIDIDLVNPAEAKAITKLVMDRLGETPLIRIGRKGLALFYRNPKPCAKITVEGGRDGQKVEILGLGQQVVGFGIHPDTGNPYDWITGLSPIDVPHADLPEVSPAQLRTLAEAVRAKLVELSYPTARITGYSTDGVRVVSERAGEPVLGSVLCDMINSLSPDMDRGDWIKVGMALKVANVYKTDADGKHVPDYDFDTYATWDEWSSTSQNGKYPGRDGTNGTRHQWDSLKDLYEPGKHVGIGTLVALAKAAGWTGNPSLPLNPLDIFAEFIGADTPGTEVAAPFALSDIRKSDETIQRRKEERHLAQLTAAARAAGLDHGDVFTGNDGVEYECSVAGDTLHVTQVITSARMSIGGNEILNQPKPEWLLHKLMQPASLNLMSGYYGHMKSFVAIHLMMRMALGLDFLGHAPSGPQRVMYMNWEGQFGTRQRVSAWAARFNGNNVPDNFRTFKRTPDMVAGGSTWAEFLAEVRWFKPALVVIDTLARAMTGMDENSTKEIGQFIARCGEITALGVAVLIVHHTGHGDRTRGRGAVALPAAMDLELLVVLSNGVVTVETKKVKDSAKWAGKKGFEWEVEKFNPEDADDDSLVLIELKDDDGRLGNKKATMTANDPETGGAPEVLPLGQIAFVESVLTTVRDEEFKGVLRESALADRVAGEIIRRNVPGLLYRGVKAPRVSTLDRPAVTAQARNVLRGLRKKHPDLIRHICPNPEGTDWFLADPDEPDA